MRHQTWSLRGAQMTRPEGVKTLASSGKTAASTPPKEGHKPQISQLHLVIFAPRCPSLVLICQRPMPRKRWLPAPTIPTCMLTLYQRRQHLRHASTTCPRVPRRTIGIIFGRSPAITMMFPQGKSLPVISASILPTVSRLYV